MFDNMSMNILKIIAAMMNLDSPSTESNIRSYSLVFVSLSTIVTKMRSKTIYLSTPKIVNP